MRLGNYAIIEYPEINLIMDLSSNCSLFPISAAKNIKKLQLSYSNYSQKICEIDNVVCVLIDFAKFLRITPSINNDNLILLRMTGLTGDFALFIPTPKFVSGSLKFKQTTEKSIDQSSGIVPVVSSNYCIIDEKIYLRIDGKQISTLLEEEISLYLSTNWKNSIPDWSNISKNTLAKLLKKPYIRAQIQSIDRKITNNDQENIIICKVNNYFLSFTESLLSELIIFNHHLTIIPNSPQWIEGLLNINNNNFPLVNLKLLFGLEDDKSTGSQIVAIIKISNSTKLGLLCDSLKIVRLPPKDIPQYLPTNMDENFPFGSVLRYQGKYIFTLNINFINKSIHDPNILNIQNNWERWRNYFNTNIKNTIKEIRSVGTIERKNLIEYIEFRYTKINILIELSKNMTLFIDKKATKINQCPHYCDGLVNLDNTICLIVDFGRYLEVEDQLIREYVLLRITHNNSNLALRIPIPKFVKLNISSQSSHIFDINNSSIEIPSAKYYITNKTVYLTFDQDKLFLFLRNELKFHLSINWENSIQNWDNLPFENILDPNVMKTKMLKSPQRVVASSTRSVGDKYLICRVGNSYLGIEEKNVNHIFMSNIIPTKIPNSPDWIDGMIDFQGEDIIQVNLSKLLQISNYNGTVNIIVVVSFNQHSIALLSHSIYNVTPTGKISIKQRNIESKNIPYSNIYQLDDNIIFLLNLEYILQSIFSFKEPKALEWQKLLSVSISDYHLKQQIGDKSRNKKNAIHAEINQISYSIPLKYILSIQPVLNKERITIDNIDFVAYNNTWIPSFQVKSENNTKIGPAHDFSLILQIDHLIIELQVDKLDLTTQGNQLIEETTWDILLKRQNPIGLLTPVEIDNGFAFQIDLEKFVNTTFNELNNKLTNIDDFLLTLNVDPPTKLSDDVKSNQQLAQIWDEESELFLIINNSEGEINKYALHTDLIQDITSELPPHVDFLNWNYGGSKSFIYVILYDEKDYEKALQIPSNCYLLSIVRENIKSKNSDTFLLVEKENIPLLKLKTGEQK